MFKIFAYLRTLNKLFFYFIEVSLSDVSDIPDPIEKVVAGLQSSSDAKIPLTSVHIRAKLQDLVAEVDCAALGVVKLYTLCYPTVYNKS